MVFDFDFPKYMRNKLGLIFVLIFSDYLMKRDERLEKLSFPFDWILYSILILILFENMSSHTSFIYFQF